MVQNVSYIVFSGLYIISGTILTIVVSHLLINRKILRPGLSYPVLVFAWIWLTTQLLEYILPDVESKILFTTLQYIGIFLLPPAWTGFCYQYTTRKREQAMRLTLILSIIPLIGIVLVFTNSFHGFIWKSQVLHANRISMIKEFARVYYFFVTYSYILFITGFIILVVKLIKRPLYQRRQSVILFAAGGLPFLANIIETFFSKSLAYLELTPLTFSVSSLIVIYFARLRYFRTIPLAQHIVIESMSDLLILLNPENQIIYLNPSASGILRNPDTPIIGKSISSIHAGLADLLNQIPIHTTGSEEIVLAGITYNVSVSPVYNWRNKIISRVVAFRDITRLKQVEENLRLLTDHLEARVNDRTKKLEDVNRALRKEIIERKKIEKKLNDSLTDKTILLGEIHHRVKNNLQIITSLLKLQKKYIKDEKNLEIFNTAISRIQSIAIIHEKLYKSQDIAHTNFAEYLKELSHYLLASHSEGIKPIQLTLDVENIFLDITRSIHCGLIINELVINAIKYAFPAPEMKQKKRKPKIHILFTSEEDIYVLKIKDNGVGIPDNVDIFQTDSLGMKIVNTLAGQLGGNLTVQNNKGMEVSIRFPVHIE